MLLAAVDTTTDQVSCAVAADGVVRAEVRVACRQRHAEQLTPAFDQVCRLAGVALADLEALAVAVGPGLFTGLRVGVATVQALGLALGVRVAEVSSLDALAHPLRHVTGEVVAAIDARRGELFWARYRGGRLVGEPQVGKPSALRDLLAASDAPVLVVGDGALRYADQLADLPGVTVTGADLAYPSATAVALLGTALADAGRLVEPARVRPVYLRAPDAVANWTERDRVVSP